MAARDLKVNATGTGGPGAERTPGTPVENVPGKIGPTPSNNKIKPLREKPLAKDDVVYQV